jgi:ribosomal protein S18 acetylase RimI-like enzyme
MEIRSARSDDAPAIARHIVMAEKEMVQFFTGSQDPEAAKPILESWVLSPTPCRYSTEFCMLAEVTDQPVGSAISFPADLQPELDVVLLDALCRRGHSLPRLSFEGEPGTYYLSTMGVDPACRGQGIGTALMAAAEERGRQLGFSRASLLVSKDKERAQALYERQGYVVIADVSIGGVAYRRMMRSL